MLSIWIHRWTNFLRLKEHWHYFASFIYLLWLVIWSRANTLHYLFHGCHHKHPMDSLRIVFPPAATAILLVPFWNLIKLLSTPSTSPAPLGGLLLGYVMYDCTHYYLHHGQPKSNAPKNL